MSRSLEDILFAAPSPQARTVTRALSVIAVAVLLLLVAAVVLRFHSAGQLDAQYWEFFAWSTTWSFLAKGLLGTLASAAMAAVIALALGLLLLLGRLSRLRLVRWPSIAVIEFLRGTPTLLLIYVCFLVLPSAGIKLSTYWMLTLPIGLSTAAVVAEVYRAGVLAVPRGQTDAARSLGLTEAQAFSSSFFPRPFAISFRHWSRNWSSWSRTPLSAMSSPMVSSCRTARYSSPTTTRWCPYTLLWRRFTAL